MKDNLLMKAPGEIKPSQLNWAGNLTYSTADFISPASIDELGEIVKKKEKIKVIGSRHSFNNIADSRDLILSTHLLNKIIAIDKSLGTVTVQGGINYGELAPHLDSQGYALHNLASLPHISIAGAISTGTHGSGVANGNLATSITALEFMLADATLLKVSATTDAEALHACAVGLGAIGIITQITLKIEPRFLIRQQVFLNLPYTQLEANFDQIVSAAYSVSLFTDWQHDSINQVWIKSKTGSVDSVHRENFYGALPATQHMHPLAAHASDSCTDQMGIDGAWYDRLPHFKMNFTPSSGQELQTEYFIPHHYAIEAIKAISTLRHEFKSYLLVTEIRTIAADDIWMSPAYRRQSVAFHFTWKSDWPAIKRILPLIEKELAAFNARPHWGKMFTMAPEAIHQQYEKLSEFKSMVSAFDPKGKFRNDFLNKYIFE